MICFCEIVLSIVLDNFELVWVFVVFYLDIGEYFIGIEYVRLCCFLVGSLMDKVYDNYVIIKGIMSVGGYWEELFFIIE